MDLREAVENLAASEKAMNTREGLNSLVMALVIYRSLVAFTKALETPEKPDELKKCLADLQVALNIHERQLELERRVLLGAFYNALKSHARTKAGQVKEKRAITLPSQHDAVAEEVFKELLEHREGVITSIQSVRDAQESLDGSARACSSTVTTGDSDCTFVSEKEFSAGTTISYVFQFHFNPVHMRLIH
jgi:hypothetical protein